MQIEITAAFSTPIGRLPLPDADVMNDELRVLLLAEEARYGRLGRSNIGGWDSPTDFFKPPEPAVAALSSWVNYALGRMINATAGPFNGNLSISAWGTVCRAGAYHAPHSHPDSAWSGVYYVDAGSENPDRPLSGLLEFLDPR